MTTVEPTLAEILRALWAAQKLGGCDATDATDAARTTLRTIHGGGDA